MQNKSDKVEM